MRVLIVEDDMIIAGGLGPAITEAGHELVGLAADRDTAVALIASSDVDLALVDLRLLDGWTGMDVARAARKNGVATIFTTANPNLLPGDLAGAFGVIEKPYDLEGVKRALAYVARRIEGLRTATPPKCLTLAPQPELSAAPIPAGAAIAPSAG